MVNIKLSQYQLFYLVNLTDEQIKQIEEEREKSTKFVLAGTKQYPIVNFYVENDAMADTKSAFGNHYDGKGLTVSYALLPKNSENNFPIIHLTAVVLNEDLNKKTVIPELELITIKKFNKYGHDAIHFGEMNYNHPYVKAAYLMEFFHGIAALSANFPIDIWEEALPLHYVVNELNSNRKWKRPEDNHVFDVVRFYDDKHKKVDYYANIYEHTPNDGVYSRKRNFLFNKVKENEIFYEE